MKARYYVSPCDNCGSVAGLARDRTWVVMDRETGYTVAEYASRADARTEAAQLNAAMKPQKGTP